ARRAVELHHAEEVGRVGERERRHVVLRRALDGVVDPDYAVAHRVFAVHPQVNEKRPPHVKKFYRKAPMKRLVLISLIAVASSVAAQNRTADLDKAYEEARTAYNEWQRAMARRDQGVESQPGERQASAAGGSRPNENYFARQAILEQQVEMARQRYDATMKRWNDLK